MTILWLLRTALFIISGAIPIIHPAAAVSYDSASAFLWFAVIPLEMAAAYFLKPSWTGKPVYTAAFLAPLAIAAVFFTRFDSYTWITAACGTAAFIFTLLQFRYKAFILGFAEASFLAVRAYRLLMFARSSEDAAYSSSLSSKLLFLAIIGLFAAHLYIVYLISYRKQGSRDCLREHLAFTSFLAVLITAVGLLLPPDFVEHAIVINNLRKEPEPKPLDGGNLKNGIPGGSIRGGNRSGGEENGNSDNKGSLEGIPAESWEGGSGEGDDIPQYAVMVIASAVDPVYAAGAYSGTLDPESGFHLSDSEILNELSYKRLIETWKDTSPVQDRDRREFETDILSTLPGRYLAYRPRTVVPTVHDGTYHPFAYSYKAVSHFSLSGPEKWATATGLSESERRDLAEYLDLPLDAAYMERLEALKNSWIGDTEGYYARIEALMQGFSTYQYQLGFDDNMDLYDIEEFLFTAKSGDCTEFSNSLALLARFIGVPSRVVTGYLASRGLQTQYHTEGLAMLRQSIPRLQEYDIDSLYLVTTAHRHSWTQLYIPPFGWIDFESTSTAIPPESSGDANSRRIVIPIIEAQKNRSRETAFKWDVLFRIILSLTALSLASVYAYKAVRRIRLSAASRSNSIIGLQSLFLLLLARMADSGCRLKLPSETAKEYAGKYPAVSGFAETYTLLRYKTDFSDEQKAELWASLRAEYAQAVKALRKQGFISLIREIFNLRGLYY